MLFISGVSLSVSIVRGWFASRDFLGLLIQVRKITGYGALISLGILLIISSHPEVIAVSRWMFGIFVVSSIVWSISKWIISHLPLKEDYSIRDSMRRKIQTAVEQAAIIQSRLAPADSLTQWGSCKRSERSSTRRVIVGIGLAVFAIVIAYLTLLPVVTIYLTTFGVSFEWVAFGWILAYNSWFLACIYTLSASVTLLFLYGVLRKGGIKFSLRAGLRTLGDYTAWGALIGALLAAVSPVFLTRLSPGAETTLDPTPLALVTYPAYGGVAGYLIGTIAMMPEAVRHVRMRLAAAMFPPAIFFVAVWVILNQGTTTPSTLFYLLVESRMDLADFPEDLCTLSGNDPLLVSHQTDPQWMLVAVSRCVEESYGPVLADSTVLWITGVLAFVVAVFTTVRFALEEENTVERAGSGMGRDTPFK